MKKKRLPAEVWRIERNFANDFGGANAKFYAMSTFILSAFLLLFGASMVIETKIPAWCIGVLAIAAGIAVLWRGLGGKS